MIQGFIQRGFETSFKQGSEPRLLSASNIHVDFSHHRRALHKHDDRCELIFVRHGSSKYVVGSRSYPITEGDMIINNSNTLHDDLLEKGDSVAYYALGIGDLQLEGLEKNHIIGGNTCPIIKTNEHYQVFNNIFSSIYELIASNKPGVEETCHYLMMAAISLVLQLVKSSDGAVEARDPSSIVSEVLEYIDENYMYDISLKLLGSHFHVSEYHLSHLFKEQTGYSPMNYVIRRRIGEAQTLLITTRDPIGEIAGRVGFANPNNFNIQFQKQVGLSPREYRRVYVSDIRSTK